jgi:hypothetical protein
MLQSYDAKFVKKLHGEFHEAKAMTGFRRFDWLAFLRHSETNQTNRLEMKPIRQRSQRPFPKSRDSTDVAFAPISETDGHCRQMIKAIADRV